MAERLAVVGTALAVLAAFWISGNERFGRPESAPDRNTPTQGIAISGPSTAETMTARFTLCDGPVRRTCVVDGDTFWFKGDKIRRGALYRLAGPPGPRKM